MSELIVIRKALHDHDSGGGANFVRVALPADRATLAKRRWRGVAEDRREFGFDLEHALSHGALFFAEGGTRYAIEQTPEEVLEIAVDSQEGAARIAWNLGNLHFGVQVVPGAIRVTDDPAVRQFLSREHIAFRRVTALFLPLSAGAHHAHGHAHG
jgi:urease accessory protein